MLVFNIWTAAIFEFYNHVPFVQDTIIFLCPLSKENTRFLPHDPLFLQQLATRLYSVSCVAILRLKDTLLVLLVWDWKKKKNTLTLSKFFPKAIYVYKECENICYKNNIVKIAHSQFWIRKQYFTQRYFTSCLVYSFSNWPFCMNLFYKLGFWNL